MNRLTSTTGAIARRRPIRVIRVLSACALAVATLFAAGQHKAHAAASTAGFRGVNRADQRDNFVNGVLYPSGLSSSDTYASAAVVADQVLGQLDSITGANTMRMPINEPTVATS